jgi:phage gpG-like protein
MMTLTIDGTAGLIKRLDDAIEAVGSPREALEETGEIVLKEIERNFDEEGARLGPKWKALKPATERDRLRQGYAPHPILQRTGALKDSFGAAVSENAVQISSDSEIYPYHQLGQGYNPKRKMLGFNDTMKQDIIEAFNRFIRKALRDNI